LFRDITPLLSQPALFSRLVDELSVLLPKGVEKIVAIESRGFILGAALASRCQLGLVLARKAGKLPGPTTRKEYTLEYGQAALDIQTSDLRPSVRVVIVDDVLATGGTAHAAVELCRSQGAEVLECLFLLELKALQGRVQLKSDTKSLFEN